MNILFSAIETMRLLGMNREDAMLAGMALLNMLEGS